MSPALWGSFAKIPNPCIADFPKKKASDINRMDDYTKITVK